MREIGLDDLADIATGAAILGTGGGGDPYIGRLMARAALRENGPVRLTPLAELPDDAVVLPVASMGAPTVMVEKLPAADELSNAVEALCGYLGRRPTHLACAEAGGVNSLIPVAAAARTGLPLIDADGMGRAFPELQMFVPGLYGVKASRWRCPTTRATGRSSTRSTTTGPSGSPERPPWRWAARPRPPSTP